MSANELEGLKKQRSTYRGLLTKLLNFANSIREHSGETIEELRLKVNRAKEILDKIDGVEASIFTISQDEESKMEECEESYYRIVSTLNNWIKKRSVNELSLPSHDISPNTSTINATPDIRLAKLKIPDFYGDYTEWQGFFDLFHSSVHSKDINPVQKFHYLMGSLKGDAFSLVKHFKITEANYIEALNKLRQRYDRKRHTVNSFIRKFLDQPIVQTANASNIRKLLDTSDEVIRGLKAMGDQAEARDPWLIYLLLQKLDDETRSQWAQENPTNEFPTIMEFLDFLLKRTDALESIKSHAVRPSKPNIPIKPRNSFAVTTNNNCIACNMQQHKLIDCDKFKELTVEERRNLIGTNRRCYNCLNLGHSVYDCTMRARCRECSRKHHSLLHLDEKPNVLVAKADDPQDIVEEDPTKTHITSLEEYRNSCSTTVKSTLQTILPTAIVSILDKYGVPRPCRALIDTASQASFITESMVQKLGLPRTNCRNLIAGIGETSSGKSKGSAVLTLASRFDTMRLASLKALIITKITSSLPSFEFDIRNMKGLEAINLADPHFYKPGSIDLLLGADIVFELWENTNMRLSESNLIAHKTKLGWILGGRYEANNNETTQSFATIVDIDATLQQFWEIEEVPQINRMTKEEQDCEDWFKATTTRRNDGRFITKLPFKKTLRPVGSTYQQATSRLLAMEKRFNTSAKFQQLYKEFLKEYQDLHHMEQSHMSNTDLQKTYILPHHGVLKDTSTTTKLRVVFDASAKSTSGVSLNENLMIGANVQSSLFQILTRFRQHRYVLVGDIEKMYRQVLVDEEDTKHQLILWRDDQQRIRPYKLNTVTYGTASAAFMATRCLKELAQIHAQTHPEASRAIEHDIYVDDLMTGVSTLPDLLKLKENVVEILKSGGFNLRKLSSNDLQMRRLISHSDSNSVKILSDHSLPMKLLGLAWDVNTDNFIFQVKFEDREVHTKRTLLSEAGKIFDPLGLLSPITIKMKILFQSLWLKKLGWDDELPPESKVAWINLRNNLCQTPELIIPRCITTSTNVSIHGFCDASKWAYAAAVYARSQNNEEFVTHLICAKTKVAPLKQISIPRLELMGALLLSRLIRQVTDILSVNVHSITLWTDSNIVLDWLSSQPRRWTTFVANRTAEIIAVHKRDVWRHVPTKHNPADCATRGKTVEEMSRTKLWWNGPAWLAKEDRYWPEQPLIPESNEEIQIKVHNTVIHEPKVTEQEDIMLALSKKYSSYMKLQAVILYMLRFANNARASANQGVKQTGAPTLQEFEVANNKIITYWQIANFADEYHCLQHNKAISGGSKLLQLNPFLDQKGIMRVGGRLQESMLAYSVIHPVIISSKSPIAASITFDTHVRNQHPGINLLMSLVRQKFWIIRGKDVAKRVFRQCIKCLRHNPKMLNQIMGQLPEDRVTYTAAFGAVGLDFCGPFKVHPIRRRGSTPIKAYLCIFVCFSTRAIHIEVCMNLTTESFLGALRRLISRRGLCHSIYCDNATNLVGAKNHLREIILSLSMDKIDWRFIPPAAPAQGGLWESAVKSAKTQITRSIGKEILTLEEFSTLTVQVEGILNSRPLCASQNDELEFLTPAHFLIGRAIHQIPEAASNQKLTLHTRWDIVNRIYSQFWKRWQLEYLTTLQLRTKWRKPHENLQLNDVVLVHDNNLPPGADSLANGTHR